VIGKRRPAPCGIDHAREETRISRDGTGRAETLLVGERAECVSRLVDKNTSLYGDARIEAGFFASRHEPRLDRGTADA